MLSGCVEFSLTVVCNENTAKISLSIQRGIKYDVGVDLIIHEKVKENKSGSKVMIKNKPCITKKCNMYASDSEQYKE